MSTQAQRPASKPREIELDFIRGLAILMVIDFHTPHPILLYPFGKLGFAHFGWAGVDIFFVLSGFLVGGLLVKEWKLFGRVDAKQFLIRRGFKIWPQYYVFLLANLLTGHQTLRFLWGNILNIQNYTRGIAHTWTLAVEEHAYLLLAFLCAFAASRHARMRTLFAILVAAAALVLTLRFTLAARGVDIFFRTDTRVDGILYGVMLAILYHFAPDIFHRLQTLRWLWIALLAVVLLGFRIAARSAWWSLPVLSFCADLGGIATLLLLYRHRSTPIQARVTTSARPRPALYRFVALIGTYSYGIYLWHVSVIDPVARLTPRLPHWLVPAWQSLGPYVCGILIGVFFTKLVEFPALKLRERLIPRRVDSAVGTPAELEQPIPAAP